MPLPSKLVDRPIFCKTYFKSAKYMCFAEGCGKLKNPDLANAIIQLFYKKRKDRF